MILLMMTLWLVWNTKPSNEPKLKKAMTSSMKKQWYDMKKENELMMKLLLWLIMWWRSMTVKLLTEIYDEGQLYRRQENENMKMKRSNGNKWSNESIWRENQKKYESKQKKVSDDSGRGHIIYYNESRRRKWQWYRRQLIYSNNCMKG